MPVEVVLEPSGTYGDALVGQVGRQRLSTVLVQIVIKYDGLEDEFDDALSYRPPQ